MACQDDSSSQSFPVLAGRYPKRKTADSSYSPTAAALHGQRKRQARTPPERKGSTVSSDGETLPSPGSLGVPSQCRPSTPCKNSTSPETAHAATPSTNSTSSSMSVASPSVFCGWKVGDHCLALYEDDGDYYEAVISRLRSRKRQQTAEVVFLGYEEDGHSVVDLTSIRPLQESPCSPKPEPAEPSPAPTPSLTRTTRMFSHGTPVEQYVDYMKSRYGEFDIPMDGPLHDGSLPDDPPKPSARASAAKTDKSPGPTSRSKSIVAEVVPSTNVTPKRPASSPLTSPKASTTPVTPTSAVPLRSAASPSLNRFDSWEPDGFSEDDLEKPKFQKAATLAKVPFVLSAPDAPHAVSIPAPLNQYLRDYQREGAKFLFKHFDERHGCVLGDDMGLGKTVQVISFMAAVLGKTNTKADVQPKFQRRRSKNEAVPYATGVFLVVTPASVLYNWEDELKMWTHLKSRVYHGAQRVEAMELARQGSVDVILTTYDTAKLSLDFINSIDWLAGVFDEAHKMKDPNSQTTQCMKGLRLRRRIGLTGTAMQNSLTELWCLLDWCNPGCLGRKEEFEEDVALPMMTGQRLDSTKRELATSRKKQKQLQEQLGKWFLRRTKAVIADQLPKKDEYVVFCPWTKLQYSVCLALLECDEFQLVLKAHDPCPCGSGRNRCQCCYSSNSEGLDWKKLILPYLSLMMKAACHLGLLLPEGSNSANQKHKARDICLKVFSKHRKFLSMSRDAAFLTLSDKEYCGKMQVLEKLLRRVKLEGSRVILFSFRTKILNLLQTFLQQQGYTFCRLDGSVAMKQRTVLVRSFNKDPGVFVFLASKSVGGVGLNITGANVVIIFDPDWNPAVDSQAQDRAFRMGQHRDVQVYRLITQGSVEENAYLRQVYKQQMTNMAVSGDIERRHFTAVMGLKRRDRRGHVKGELFSFENMFTIRQEASCMTEDILKRTARVEHGILMAKDEVSSFASSASDEVENAKSPEKGNDVDLLEELSQAIQNEEVHHAAEPLRQSPRRKRISAPHGVRKDGKLTKSSEELQKVSTDSWSSDETDAVVSAKAAAVRASTRASYTTATSPLPVTADSGVNRDQPQAECTSPVLRCGRSVKVSLPRMKVQKRQHPSLSSDEKEEVAGPPGLGARTLSAANLLVGTSRAERRMSRHAMRDVFDKNQLSQQPANCLVDESSDESDDLGERAKLQQEYRPVSHPSDKQKEIKEDDEVAGCLDSVDPYDGETQEAIPSAPNPAGQVDAPSFRRHHGSLVLVGQTPPAVRRQHFERLSALLGHNNVLDFAREVVESDTEQRQAWLELLYGMSNEDKGSNGGDAVASTAYKDLVDPRCGPGIDDKPIVTVKKTASDADGSRPVSRSPPITAEVLAEDSYSSLGDGKAAVSPLRRNLAVQRKDCRPRCDAAPMKTIIPESESCGGGDQERSSLVSLTHAGKQSAAARPDAEQLFASFLADDNVPSCIGCPATGVGSGLQTSASQNSASVLGSGNHEVSDGEQPSATDHDLALADMLFG